MKEAVLTVETPFICPECAEIGRSTTFNTYQSKYWHRKHEHGILPSNPGQYSKPKNKKSSILEAVDQDAPTSNHLPSETISRSQADAENLINFLAGSCLEQIKTYAAEFGIPKTVITDGVISILHSTASGSVHGPRHSMPSLRIKTS